MLLDPFIDPLMVMIFDKRPPKFENRIFVPEEDIEKSIDSVYKLCISNRGRFQKLYQHLETYGMILFILYCFIYSSKSYLKSKCKTTLLTLFEARNNINLLKKILIESTVIQFNQYLVFQYAPGGGIDIQIETTPQHRSRNFVLEAQVFVDLLKESETDLTGSLFIEVLYFIVQKQQAKDTIPSQQYQSTVFNQIFHLSASFRPDSSI